MASKPDARVTSTQSGLAFEGVIDHQSVPNLLSLFPGFKDQNKVLDLSKVSKIDSAGLAFLIYLGNEYLAKGTKLRLKGASTQALQLINIMRLESVFDLE